MLEVLIDIKNGNSKTTHSKSNYFLFENVLNSIFQILLKVKNILFERLKMVQF